MNTGKTVFAQLMSFLPTYEFNKCVEKYKGNHRVRNFTCKEHFYVMGFAQLTYKESLRDIQSCLTAFSNKLYHSGIKQPVPKSTLAEANESRDWRIYADYALVAGFAGLHTHICTFDGWFVPRCQCNGPYRCRARGHLCNGQRLCRFLSVLHHHPRTTRVPRDQGQG